MGIHRSTRPILWLPIAHSLVGDTDDHKNSSNAKKSGEIWKSSTKCNEEAVE